MLPSLGATSHSAKRRVSAHSSPVNAGIGDTGNGFWVRFLRLNATTLSPRLVVMQVLDNDFVDNVREGVFALRADGSLDELPIAAQGAGCRGS